MRQISRHGIRIGLLLLGLALSGIRIQAQEPSDAGPTMKETVDWLTQTLPKACSFSCNLTATYKNRSSQTTLTATERLTDLHIDGCRVTFKVFQSLSAISGDDAGFEYTFKLSDLDPVSGRIVSADRKEADKTYRYAPKQWRLKFQTSKRAKTVQSRFTYHGEIRNDGAVDSVGFSFIDKEIAQKVMEAFKHAIKLCGGKVDPS